MAKGKYEYWLTEDGLTLLEGWARNGLTDEQIAHNMGINRRTLTDWKNKHSPISLTLKKGKEIVDFEVQNSLEKRAKGYDYEEITFEYRFNEETREYEKTPVKAIRKHMPPDVLALIFWLKNRMPDKWREKQKEETDTSALDKLDSILSEIKEDAKRSTK